MSEAVNKALEESFSKEVLIEEFIDGVEVSVESISFEGKHYIVQITDKVTTGSPHFVELEHHQPSALAPKTQIKIREVVNKALDFLHVMYGASHSELKITPDNQVKVIEIGARGGGDFIASHLVQLSTGFDFMKSIINVSLGIFEKPEIKEHKYSGVYFLSKETGRLLSLFNHLDEYPEIIDAEITDNVLRNISCSGDRSGFLIYQSDRKVLF